MPFFSIPFHVPYPSWTLTPMEHGIYLFMVSAVALILGAPSSIIAIRQRHRSLGWLSLLGCMVTWPLGVAATFIVAFVFGEHINVY
jgi:ABC-type proline/glycine betaine transport system permease subunit